MRRSVRLRLTVCVSTAAATVALGVLSAPAASAQPADPPCLPDHIADSMSNAPSKLSAVPYLGRKLS